jgi:uncharacterized membrane protein
MTNTPPSPQSTYYAEAPYIAPRTPKVDGLAVAGMVLGIVGIIFGFLYTIPCAVGVVLSSVALYRIGKSNGWRTGKGFAVAGLVCGVVGLAFWGLIFLAVLGSSS